MKISPIVLLSALMSALCLAACGGNNPPPADPLDAAIDATPAPRISATITPASVPAGASFRMMVTIENFELVDPQTMPGAVPGKGHFHYQLDTAPSYTAAWYTGVNVPTAASTPPGEHTIRLWLVDSNHLEITPLVETTLTVTVE
jgi:hypothetical protein